MKIQWFALGRLAAHSTCVVRRFVRGFGGAVGSTEFVMRGFWGRGCFLSDGDTSGLDVTAVGGNLVVGLGIIA